jgi:prepilin signal peptidase PulO-like enzyme (type II secretory pathway)
MPRPASLVEIAATAVGAGFVAATATGLTGEATFPIALMLTAAATLWIVVSDIASFTIPDGATLLFAFAGLGSRLAAEPSPLVTVAGMALQAALVGGAFWAVREIWYRRNGFDGLGLGDVKLAAAGGLAVGAFGVSVAVLVAALAGIGLFVAARAAGRGPSSGMRLPFGAFLAPPLLAIWTLDPDGLVLMAIFSSAGAIR